MIDNFGFRLKRVVSDIRLNWIRLEFIDIFFSILQIFFKSLQEQLDLNQNRPYHQRRVPSMANLTNPNSPFQSRAPSRKGSHDDDDEDDVDFVTSPQRLEPSILELSFIYK